MGYLKGRIPETLTEMMWDSGKESLMQSPTSWSSGSNVKKGFGLINGLKGLTVFHWT